MLSTQSYARSYAPISTENSDSKSIFTKYIIEGLGEIRPDVDGQGRTIPETGSVDDNDNGSVTPESPLPICEL